MCPPRPGATSGGRRAARPSHPLPSPPRRGCRRFPQPPGRCHPPAAAPAPFPPSPAKLLSLNATSRPGAGRFPSPRGSGAELRARGVALRLFPPLGARLRLLQRPRPPLLLLWWAAGGCGGRAAAAAGSAPAPAAADRGGCAEGSGRPLENGGFMNLLFLFSFFLWRCGLRPLGWHRRRQGYAPTPLLFHEVRGEETGSAAFPAPGPGQRRAGGGPAPG